MRLGVETLGSGPDLVILPGWAMPVAVMRPWLEPLSRRWRVTAIDLPGQGRSPDAPFDLDGVAGRMLELAPAGAVWAGWSLGGQIALAAARAGAAPVGLLLIGATPRFVHDTGWPWGRPHGEVESMRQRLARDPERTVRRFAAMLATGDGGRAAAARLAREAGGGPLGLASGLACLHGTDLRLALGRLGRLPAVWVSGDRDPLVPAEAAAAAAEAMPGGRLEVVGDAGHMPFLTHARAVNAALETLRTE